MILASFLEMVCLAFPMLPEQEDIGPYRLHWEAKRYIRCRQLLSALWKPCAKAIKSGLFELRLGLGCKQLASVASQAETGRMVLYACLSLVHQLDLVVFNFGDELWHKRTSLTNFFLELYSVIFARCLGVA